MLAKNFVQEGGIAEVGLVKQGLRRHGGTITLAEVVEDDDLDARGDENFRADAADIAGPTSDENVQA